MSIGYTLTQDQYTQVQGQYYTEYQFFNCVLSIDNVWFLFLSDEDKPEVEASEYAWVLDLPEAEYIPPPPPPFPPVN
jgi:hypothetical protein